ncbi:class I SAM-dependent methyltransferase [Actinoplanes sp. NPDC049548]|uniref:class I SAM-dependent methyltransferase n=1 Tax=Actinoplanes sp. NPDC049548 TaxID=3155152 RepID=UPI0034232302
MAHDYDSYRRDLWRDKAAAYQDSFAGLCAHPVDLLLDSLAVSSGTTVLDVGCGTGTLTSASVARGADVTAVDAEPSMVAATAARVPSARTSLAALPRLPFHPGAFDAVAANFVVNHVARPAPAVAELARVTRRSGRVGVTVWPQPAPPLQRLWDDVIEAAGVIRPPMPGLAPEDDFPRTRDGLADLLEQGGLTGVESWTVEWEHRTDPGRWWAAAASGLAGIGYVISLQDAATVRRMKDCYDELVRPHLDGNGRLCLPTAALLATGRPTDPEGGTRDGAEL